MAQIQFEQIGHVPERETRHDPDEVVGEIQHSQVVKHPHLNWPQVTGIQCCKQNALDSRAMEEKTVS